jgi:hypothetical protein
MQRRAVGTSGLGEDVTREEVVNLSRCDQRVVGQHLRVEDEEGWRGIALSAEQKQQGEAAEEVERLRGLVLEVLDYWESGNWRILYVEHMRGWRKRALDTLGPIAQEEAAKVAASRSSRPAASAVVVNVPIGSVRV